ncbi:MAG: hypothetical protein H0U74_08950 [Bradymonadaceae bacterium]|nr:hypothetical protein [Lujinxingiaceae bacterium]
MNLIELCKSYHQDESGATSTEYLILLILIACFIIMVVKKYGDTLGKKYRSADELVRKEVTF